jgi:hypothetical protein
MATKGVDFGAVLADLDCADLVLYSLVMVAQERGKIAAATAATALDMTPAEYQDYKRMMTMAGQRLALRLVPDTRRKVKGAA